ncbi:hypothetical protein R5W24_002929 [Gemmata sp. JC717]|uniref:hypothetical protein n=1 Tax=Gemmata algarum TaxID=2975278 RepID=UPI0021BA9DAF|nr:hypothetical protein [Gemmata algarum]MDY3553815.1 hypothetical protein [Gemmata algarum]
MAARLPPALNLAVLCSDVEFDGNQRPFSLNEPQYAIGVLPDEHGRLSAPELTLYVQLDDEHALGTFWFLIEARTASGFVIPGGRTARTEITFTGNPDPMVPFEHAFDLRDLVFPEPGWYHFHVVCNHTSLNERSAFPASRLRVVPAERSARG